MTTTRRTLTPAQKNRFRLIGIGAFLLGFPLFFGSLATDAAVHQGCSPDVWWLWAVRAALASFSVLVAWKVISAEDRRPAARRDATTE